MTAPGHSRVLASGFGSDGRGGIFEIGDRVAAMLDPIPTTGLSYDGSRLARLLRGPGEFTSTAELVVYDRTGVVDYRRLDTIRDPHDVLAVEDGWIIVSTGTNEIVRLDSSGVRPVWRGPDVPDSWHVNCVTMRGGELWASAFGKFDEFKGWQNDRSVGTGFVWNLRTGDEIGGLTHPHTPRFLDDDLLVCESHHRTLVRRHANGATQSLDLGGYTRGIVLSGDQAFVGVSSHRDHAGNAHIAVVDLESFACVDRIELACSEVYDLAVVPAEILNGVRTGFGTNAYRVATVPFDLLDVSGQRGLGAWLEKHDCGCRIDADLPNEMPTAATAMITVAVENTGRASLASVAPHPVFVASRWVDATGGQVDGARMPLPVPLAPDARAEVRLPITAPAAGSYRLSISLVLEGEFWFDDLDVSFGAGTGIRVT